MHQLCCLLAVGLLQQWDPGLQLLHDRALHGGAAGVQGFVQVRSAHGRGPLAGRPSGARRGQRLA
jgi:hypothetical protein